MKPHTHLGELFRLNTQQQKSLAGLGISTVEDLLYYFPVRYGDSQSLSYICNLKAGNQTIIYAQVKSIHARKAWRSKTPMSEAVLEEPSGDTIKSIWFSQPYISKMLHVGTTARFAGTVNERKGELWLVNPEFERVKSVPIEQTGALFDGGTHLEEQTLYPVYRERKGISSKWLYHHMQKLFTSGALENIPDPIPEKIRTKYRLPSLANALVYIHAPKKKHDAEAARKRFAFEEIFFAQLVRQKERQEYEQSGAFTLEGTNPKLDKFLSSLPFQLTRGQRNAVDSILIDMTSEVPMSRLLEGDVGSGKTIVAAAAALAVALANPRGQKCGHLQVAYMAPTEILAKQIFAEFCELFAQHNIQIGLLTSKDCRKFPSKTDRDATSISKAQLLKWTLNGEIQIVIGTHALISKNVFFENLGLVIIDEQHRFGKKQRAALRDKGKEKLRAKSANPHESQVAKTAQSKIKKSALADNDEVLPHLLSMTATPIPRTLALTIYGDLDLTVLDELPPGRKKIKTTLVHSSKREEAYRAVETELQGGRQAYVICPRIDDADPNKHTALQVRSAVGEADRLRREVFPEYKIGVMHSKLAKKDKDTVMQRFADGEYNILVSTSVVEVGVNVPNATCIIIEGAERFGLAQLHQLRGRVMRSSHQPYCYLFTDSQNKTNLDRLRVLTTAANGFELAEADLQFRGSGEMLGNKQSGMGDLAMEALANLKLVEAARNEAVAIVRSDTLEVDKAMYTKYRRVKQVVYME